VSREERVKLPLKNCLFTADIVSGYADLIFHQKYENTGEDPLEIDFMMPVSDSFTISKIVIDFTLEDGS
jgi:hypothetical protein